MKLSAGLCNLPDRGISKAGAGPVLPPHYRLCRYAHFCCCCFCLPAPLGPGANGRSATCPGIRTRLAGQEGSRLVLRAGPPAELEVIVDGPAEARYVLREAPGSAFKVRREYQRHQVGIFVDVLPAGRPTTGASTPSIRPAPNAHTFPLASAAPPVGRQEWSSGEMVGPAFEGSGGAKGRSGGPGFFVVPPLHCCFLPYFAAQSSPMLTTTPESQLRAALLGLAVADALGVPVEFQSRTARRLDPVVTMREYGTHHQPAGTWSDDASLTFCLAESLCRGYDLADLSRRFINWYEHAYWTPHGRVFDVGVATSEAIRRLSQGVLPLDAGGSDEYSNGNGSLMRILPLAFWVQNLPVAERFRLTREVSSLTHAHPRSILGCFIYLEMARQLLVGLEKHAAYQAMQQVVNDFGHHEPTLAAEIHRFHRLLENPYGDYEIQPLTRYREDEISGSGYVLHTLEAALWCLLRHETYAESVLAAVNLGDDTDTTGAVTGGLAGLYYGEATIPAEWLAVLARRTDIENLAHRMAARVEER